MKLFRSMRVTALAALAALVTAVPYAAVSAQTAPAGAIIGGPYKVTSYVALGDSIAAGLGLAQSPTATDQDKVCGRSTQAYAAKVVERIKDPLVLTNAACQGAVTANMGSAQAIGTASIPAQLDTAFAGGTPRLITLTVGANDMHWADYIKACLGLTCDAAENTASVAALRNVFQANLGNVLDSIKARSGTGRLPQVVVTGYYKPFSSACVSGSLTASEIKWFSDQTDLMNQTIKSVANAHSTYVTFAPLDFTGHDICSTDPWIQRPGVDPAAFHPNAKGQDAMAKAITQALRLKQL